MFSLPSRSYGQTLTSLIVTKTANPPGVKSRPAQVKPVDQSPCRYDETTTSDHYHINCLRHWVKS